MDELLKAQGMDPADPLVQAALTAAREIMVKMADYSGPVFFSWGNELKKDAETKIAVDFAGIIYRRVPAFARQ